MMALLMRMDQFREEALVVLQQIIDDETRHPDTRQQAQWFIDHWDEPMAVKFFRQLGFKIEDS